MKDVSLFDVVMGSAVLCIVGFLLVLMFAIAVSAAATAAGCVG